MGIRNGAIRVGGNWLAAIVACVAFGIPSIANANGIGEVDQFTFGDLSLKGDGFKDLMYAVLCGAGYEAEGSYEEDGDLYLRRMLFARHMGNTGDTEHTIVLDQRDGSGGGVVPEPSAALVFSLGMLVTGARLRRQRQ